MLQHGLDLFVALGCAGRARNCGRRRRTPYGLRRQRRRFGLRRAGKRCRSRYGGIATTLQKRQILAPPHLHQLRKPPPQDLQVSDHAADVLRVKRQRLFELLEDAREIDHEPARLAPLLAVLVRPVHPRDGLQ